MHLTEMLAYRTTPGAAVFLALTQRCPLRCRHCCTDSLMESEQHEESIFEGLVDSFTPDCRPKAVYLTGGEALLRPGLVIRLTEKAHRVGSQIELISGMYFLRNKSVPPMVQRAIDGVDHFTASLDVFHEEQVDRIAVLDYLAGLIDAGKDVSLQVVGVDDEDPYLEAVTSDAVRVTGGRMPILVTHLSNIGRATDLFDHAPGGNVHELGSVSARPCELASWPVVSYDGTVYACCNQEAISRKGPDHLKIGHATDGWPTLLQRYRDTPFLRVVRVLGPQMIATAVGQQATDDFCRTCMKTSQSPDSDDVLLGLTRTASFQRLETALEHVTKNKSADLLIGRHGSRRYAELALLGAPGKPTPDTAADLIGVRQ